MKCDSGCYHMACVSPVWLFHMLETVNICTSEGGRHVFVFVLLVNVSGAMTLLP